ncbi:MULTISPECIES: hypothetical protein [Haloferax]|uniref:DUF7123 domain-containing protein n=1 Tax=Haloferax marinum TaxID=2666143 RepID=A0A6A8G451_9EURY|nr:MULTISPECIES: hypothetical protein [Haloferax]KAB1196982.1 hypothetical protein Hfx1150_05375 [Haloferax sp. CBA1150]MRW96004.1 hypothetical protein [Haloferax marinum]
MSTTATATAVEGDVLDTTSSLSEKQRRILQYLRQNAESQMYFKSRLIAEDLDLTSKEVGANMRPILDGDFDVTVEKWGYSSGTTWKVTV